MRHDRRTIDASQGALRFFSPGILLPEQLFDGTRMQPPPEQRLLIALLEDAIYCFEKCYGARSSAGLRLFREAEHWLMNETQCRPFSFEHVCFVLGLDPHAVRRMLLLRQARNAAPPRDDEAPWAQVGGR